MSASRDSRLPLWAKVLYTAFVAVLVPVYWQTYGPTNFLYFCDVALLMAVFALWLEMPLLASMPAVGILLPQALWCIDFLGVLFGLPVLGLTDYMFDSAKPFFTRFLSFFHFWLPFVLVWLVWKLGYDRRAVWSWTIVAWLLVLICYLFMPAPPPPEQNPNLPVNINYVYGFSDTKAQTWMNQHLYVVVLMVALPVVLFVPTHLMLARVFKPSNSDVSPA